MLAITHAAIAVAGATAIIGTTEPTVLFCAVVASQLPDLDTTKSYSGRVLYPLAKFLEERYPHRSITHSLLFTFALAVCSLPVCYFFSWKHWLAIVFGHLLSSAADTFTKSGVRLLYPNRIVCVCGRNPKLRLATGTGPEYMVLVAALAILLLSANLISGGGLEKQFATKFLTTNQTAAGMLLQESQRAIQIRVVGTRRYDNSQVDELFWAIDVQGSNTLIVLEDDKILRVADNGDIIPRRVEVKEGRRRMKVRRQRIQEVDANIWVNSLSSTARVSGSLQLETPGEIQLPLPAPGAINTISKSGEGVNLVYARKDELKAIDEYYILSGEVVIKEL